MNKNTKGSYGRRLLEFQYMLLDEIDRYGRIISDDERDWPLSWEKVHSVSCGRIGWLMAEKRNVDPELSAMACSCHDFGRIITGKQEGHAEAGYGPIRDFLEKTGLFTASEIKIISEAVKNHSRKSETGGDVEEIVKDADVLDFHLYGYDMPRDEQQKRLRRILDTADL